MDVLCVLHDSDEYGVCRWPLSDLARAAGVPLKLLKELVDKDVLKGSDKNCKAYLYTPRHAGKDGETVTLVEQSDAPCWYCSRFVRDEWVRQKRGIVSRFSEENQPTKDAKKPTPNSQPKGGIGERQGYGPTSTSTSSISKEQTHTHSPPQGCVSDFEKPTGGALAAMAMKRGGIDSVSPQHPKLLAMVAAGVTPEQFEQASVEAVKKSKGFAYALGILEGQLREANALTADGLAMPEKPWDESRSSIEAEGERLGLGRWDEAGWSVGKGIDFKTYQGRVSAARAAEKLGDE